MLSTGDTIRAVLVEGLRLTVARLRYTERAGTYVPDEKPTSFEVEGGNPSESIETATIAGDSQGRCWIAYPWIVLASDAAGQVYEGQIDAATVVDNYTPRTAQ